MHDFCEIFQRIFVIRKKSCTFAIREPAKPLNNAQMCGSFFLQL